MRFEWRGFIAAILAGGLSLTLVMAVFGAVWQGRPLSDKGGEVLVAILVAVAAAISAYFATRDNGNGKRPEVKPKRGQDEQDMP